MEATIDQRQYEAELNQEKMAAKENEYAAETTPDASDQSSSSILTLIIFLPIAIAADLLGGLDLTGIGGILVRIADIPILGILWLWRAIKQGTGKNYTYQLLLTFLVEISPVGIIPTWTTFVLYVYFKDTKLGKQTIGKAEKMNKIKK